MLLADPASTVPPPAAPGPVGTVAWLRATVSRFASGETHTRRRALAEAMPAELGPAKLRGAARVAAARERRAAASPPGAAPPPAAGGLPLVVIDLAGHPSGAGPRACPGEAHARALAAGVVEGAR